MKKIAVLMLLIVTCSMSSHKFYVSDTNIEHSVTTQSYQITLKIFTDDLELALGSEAIHLGSDNEASNANTLIESYIQSHLKVWFNDQLQLLSYIGKEQEADMTICYLEMYQNEYFNVLKVENTLLMERFPEQMNIVRIGVGGRSQTLILTKDKTSETILR